MTHLCSVNRAIEESSRYMNTTIQFPPRQRLVAERLRRHWTQLEVADQLGTTPGNVSRWERGITSPGPYFRNKLCELFGRNARELGLTWDESDNTLNPYTQVSALEASFMREESVRNYPSFTDRADLLALLHSMIRPDKVAALRSILANGGPGELNLHEQENGDQAWLAQTVVQYLQELILDNMGAMVLVVLNSNVGSRPSSLQKSLYQRHTSRREDCCDEYPPMQGTLRQRQGA
jgi:transcriptional regulator with XRE-family HTH domain